MRLPNLLLSTLWILPVDQGVSLISVVFFLDYFFTSNVKNVV